MVDTIPKIELPGNEPEVLTNLLDAAIKHLGLQSAEACVYFAKKIAAAKEISINGSKLNDQNIN